MASLKARLANLEQLLDEPECPTWIGMVAAPRRLGRYSLREINHVVFGLPGPTSAEDEQDEQAAQDRTLVAAWDRRHSIEPEPLSPVTKERIVRWILQQIKLGESWPVY